MIKNDYKPKKIKNPIFSEKKAISRAPIIMAVVSIALVSWGISQSISDSDTTSESQEITQIDSIETAVTAENEAPKSQKKRFELDLNLGGTETTQRSSTKTGQVERPTVAQAESPQKNTIQLALDNNEPAKEQIIQTEPTIKWQTSRIKSGDSTARVFKRHGLSATDLHNIMQVGKTTKTLERIQAGHVFEYGVTKDGDLAGIRYHIDKLNTLEVLQVDGQWQAEGRLSE